MKIYSSFQTNDQMVINQIQARGNIWTPFTMNILKPYESILLKDLSSYEGIPYSMPTDYNIKQIQDKFNNLIVQTTLDENMKMI